MGEEEGDELHLSPSRVSQLSHTPDVSEHVRFSSCLSFPSTNAAYPAEQAAPAETLFTFTTNTPGGAALGCLMLRGYRLSSRSVSHGWVPVPPLLLAYQFGSNKSTSLWGHFMGSCTSYLKT